MQPQPHQIARDFTFSAGPYLNSRDSGPSFQVRLPRPGVEVVGPGLISVAGNGRQYVHRQEGAKGRLHGVHGHQLSNTRTRVWRAPRKPRTTEEKGRPQARMLTLCSRCFDSLIHLYRYMPLLRSASNVIDKLKLRSGNVEQSISSN